MLFSSYISYENIRVGNPKSGIRPIFGQFLNPESESAIRNLDNGFGLLIFMTFVALKILFKMWQTKTKKV